MKAKFISNVIAPRSVCVELHGNRWMHFTLMRGNDLLVHYFESKVGEKSRSARVSKCDVKASLHAKYAVYEDSPESFAASVDNDDPAIRQIVSILTEDNPHERADVLLSIVADAEDWPREFTTTVQKWIKEDADADSDVLEHLTATSDDPATTPLVDKF